MSNSPQVADTHDRLLFEKDRPGSAVMRLPKLDVPAEGRLPGELRRQQLPLPSLPEVEVVRHYTALSRKNFGVDTGFYPLGSCTMKYNPRVNEAVARLPGFSQLHPFLPETHCQGALRLMHELEQLLCAITGMDAYTLQPAAGAHGEFTGVLVMKAHFDAIGERRRKMLIPDSAHGTNPASVALSGFESVELKGGPDGCVDLDALERAMDSDVVGMMLTNPNTHGLFEKDILEIARIVHEHGGLLYGDGANANALLGVARFGDLGFDLIHLNLHKSFSTPHGGGGPGSGPLGVKRNLEQFLPAPRVKKTDDGYALDRNAPQSIGRMKAFWGNFAMLLRAYAYIRANGPEGLRGIAEDAVLGANYLRARLCRTYRAAFPGSCMHEFILSDEGIPNGVTTADIGKRLLDFGVHAPTIYFPLTVKGAMMIETAETESRERLDHFAGAMERIATESRDEPDKVRGAPWTTSVRRLDGVLAARKPVLRWRA